MSYPSTFLDIQDAVLSKGRMDATEDRTKVKDWINQTQADAVLRTECLIGVATMTPVAGCTSQTLANAAMRIKGLFVSYGGQQYAPLRAVSMDQILNYRKGGAQPSSTPAYYAVLGLHEIEFYPTPAAGQVLTIYYVKAPVVLSADSDVPEIPEPFASKLLEYGALAEAADFKRDDYLQNYQQRYLEWVGKLQSHLNRIAGGVSGQIPVLGTSVFMPHDPSADVRGW